MVPRWCTELHKSIDLRWSTLLSIIHENILAFACWIGTKLCTDIHVPKRINSTVMIPWPFLQCHNEIFFFFRKIYWELLDILAWQICDWHSRSSEVEHIKVLTTLWRLDTNTSPGGPWMTLGISFKIFLCGLTDQVLDFLNDHRGFTPISCMTVKCGEIRTRYYIRHTLRLSNLS